MHPARVFFPDVELSVSDKDIGIFPDKADATSFPPNTLIRRLEAATLEQSNIEQPNYEYRSVKKEERGKCERVWECVGA